MTAASGLLPLPTVCLRRERERSDTLRDVMFEATIEATSGTPTVVERPGKARNGRAARSLVHGADLFLEQPTIALRRPRPPAMREPAARRGPPPLPPRALRPRPSRPAPPPEPLFTPLAPDDHVVLRREFPLPPLTQRVRGSHRRRLWIAALALFALSACVGLIHLLLG